MSEFVFLTFVAAKQGLGALCVGVLSFRAGTIIGCVFWNGVSAFEMYTVRGTDRAIWE